MESAQGISQGSDAGVSQSVLTQAQPAQAPSAPVQAPDATSTNTASERYFRQNEVDNIVKRAKLDAVESYKRLQVQQPEYFQQKYGDVRPEQPSVAPENDVRKLISQEFDRQRESIQQEAQRKSQESEVQRIVNNFTSKFNAGKEKYQDFEKVVGDVQFVNFPHVVQIVSDHVDNAADMLYELGKDRIKLANLQILAEKSPNDALIQAQRLSQSLKDNEAASKVRVPNEPLSQMRPSNTGMGNHGDISTLSVRDFRKIYKC